MTTPRPAGYVAATTVTPGYQRVWACDPPPAGATWEVVTDEWNAAYDTRTIHEIKITGQSGA